MSVQLSVIGGGGQKRSDKYLSLDREKKKSKKKGRKSKKSKLER